MSSYTNKIARLLAKLSQLLNSHFPPFVPGLTLKKIQEQLASFPFKLPDELVYYFQSGNGLNKDAKVLEIVPDAIPSSLSECLAYRELTIHICTNHLNPDQLHEFLSRPAPDPYHITEVPPRVWDRYWFPLFSSKSHARWITICSDEPLSISPIYNVPLGDASIYMEYDSLTAMLATTVEAFERGAYYFEDGELKQHALHAAQIKNKHNPLTLQWYFDIAGNPTTIEAMITQLGSQHYYYWNTAMNLIQRVGNPEIIPLLMDEVKSNNPQVGISAIQLLGELGDPSDRRLVELLLPIMRFHRDADLRIAAQNALANLKALSDPF